MTDQERKYLEAYLAKLQNIRIKDLATNVMIAQLEQRLKGKQ